MNGRQRFELYSGLHQLNVGCHKEVARKICRQSGAT
jgi:hypothetical protein